MSGFIAKAACHGTRPAAFRDIRYFQRPLLVSHLMGNRMVARFIIAPSGYGKTTLMLDYAETVFSFSHVFWINGASPCFLRDLDAGVLAASLSEADGNLKLVVFDDVPYLDEARAERFSAAIDELIGLSCEVMVALPPACDVYASLQRDRIVLQPADLLLSDAEWEAAASDAAQLESSAGNAYAFEVGSAERLGDVPVAARVPMLAWAGAPECCERFLAGLAHDEMPLAMQVCAASIHAVGRGALSHLARIPGCTPELFGQMADMFPHLGIDCESDRFETAPFAVEALYRAYRTHMKSLTDACRFESVDELGELWAYMLVDERNCARACGVVQRFCRRPVRAAWIVGNCKALLKAGCLYDVLCLCETARHGESAVRARLAAIEAFCKAVLASDAQVERDLRPIAFAKAIPIGQRMPALAVIAYFADDVSAQRAREAIAKTIPLDDGFDPLLNEDFWTILAHASCYDHAGFKELHRYWSTCVSRGYDADALAALASLLLVKALRAAEKAAPERPFAFDFPIGEVEAYVRNRLDACGDVRRDYFLVSAGLVIEQTYSRAVLEPVRPLEAPVLLALHVAEMDLLRQRRAYRQHVQEQQRKLEKEAVSTQLESSGAGNVFVFRQQPSIPILYVRMFGRFDIAKGNEQFDLGLLRRKKVQLLLFALVLSKGREVHRNTLANILWPRSDTYTARRNLWSISSHLRHALALPDGSCPYILKTQRGFSINERYVRSDAGRLDDICRELQFGMPDVRSWTDLCREIGTRYRDDLLPAEEDSRFVERARNDYRLRLVEALVHASTRIVQQGEPQCGIWLARAAIEHDATREDAYMALMRAQAAAGQRTAAIMTFQDCRAVLRDELGIDPTAEAYAFYERLIAVPEALAKHA